MNPSNRLWTKDFIIFSSMNFFLILVVYLLFAIMGVYAVNEYGTSTSQAGLIIGIFIIGVLIGRLFAGATIERVGYPKMLFGGLVLFVLATGLYFLQYGITGLLVARFVHGVTLGIAHNAVSMIVAFIIPEERKGEGIGFFSMSQILSTAMGPFLGIYMIQHTNYRMIFSLCLGLGIINLMTAFFVTIPNTERQVAGVAKQSFRVENYFEPKAIPISIVMLVLGFCYSSVLTYITFYAIEIEQVNAASFFFLMYSIAILLSRPFSGRLLDAKGANVVMYPAFLFYTAGMFLLSTAQSAFSLLLASILIGLGYGNMQSCMQAIAIKSAPQHQVGVATTTFIIFSDIGLGFGPYVLGFMIPYMSYSKLYAMLALVVFVSIGLYFILHGRDQSLRTDSHHRVPPTKRDYFD